MAGHALGTPCRGKSQGQCGVSQVVAFVVVGQLLLFHVGAHRNGFRVFPRLCEHVAEDAQVSAWSFLVLRKSLL